MEDHFKMDAQTEVLINRNISYRLTGMNCDHMLEVYRRCRTSNSGTVNQIKVCVI